MDIHTRYDTSDVPERDRFAYWRESVCDTYVKLGCDAEKRSGFWGLIDIARHPVLSISQVAGRAHKVDRRPRDIRSASDSFFLLSLQTAQSSRITQFGKTAILRPGDMALYTSSDPYTLELSDEFSQTVVQLPTDKLISRLPNAEMLTAKTIDGQTGIGKLVRENILAFAQHASSADPTVQSLVQDTLIDLIATGLASEQSGKLELSSPEQHVMLRVKSFIRNHLEDPNLDRNMVAAEMGMSVRRLNDIFAKEDLSIAAFIRQARLRRIADDLTDPRSACLSISEIAFRWGYSNMQNFSTTFRSHFGISPRAYRKQPGCPQ
ncbi:helix-turn-helix domain-containing protein [Yoonia sp. SS1-5]|uniref:Helix-turn-helix domain-containing protein n=1 Tax=Yoonia rhodophyticola TaxID=3137370 RepID=A0AAN0MD68_9RHOB